MRKILTTVFLCALTGAAFAAEPIALRDMGSFHVGGRVVEITGKPVKEVVFTPGGVPAKVDPERQLPGRADVRSVLPAAEQEGKAAAAALARRRAYGRDLRDQAGRPARLAQLFHSRRLGHLHLRCGGAWPVGWSSTFKGEAMELPFNDPWERFRIGPIGSWNDDAAKRTTFPGAQFPTDAYGQFMKQGVPRWVTTDAEIINAYIALVDKVCPCIVLVHSQSGTFGYKALEARPDKVKALVAVEPTLAGDKDKIASIKGTPILTVIGDNAKDHPRWKNIRQNSVVYAEAFKAAGGDFTLVDLPDAGIKGNSHLMMMDKNSDQIAALIQKWLVSKGLAE
ncbi:MAG: esterase [Pseudolabrys sp.]